jgi:hypothetical protein
LFLYYSLRRLLELQCSAVASEREKEIEILLLRHRLRLLERQVARPQLTPADRALFGCVQWSAVERGVEALVVRHAGNGAGIGSWSRAAGRIRIADRVARRPPRRSVSW